MYRFGPYIYVRCQRITYSYHLKLDSAINLFIYINYVLTVKTQTVIGRFLSSKAFRARVLNVLNILFIASQTVFCYFRSDLLSNEEMLCIYCNDKQHVFNFSLSLFEIYTQLCKHHFHFWTQISENINLSTVSSARRHFRFRTLHVLGQLHQRDPQ